jgi:two-component system, sensor histidine kinase and response regulator
MYNKLLNNYTPEILIVDDISENIQVIASILQTQGVDISIATSGQQAIDSVTQDPPDLILLDISMPEMDGLEACQKIKEIEKAKNVPIIFLTALSENENIIAGFDAGAVDYITKPFNSKELIQRVKTHLAVKLSNDYIIKQNNQLKSLNKTKDRLFSIIAHDLKNPFNSIIGFTNLLRTNYDSFDEEKKFEYIEIINNSAKNGYQLLENLLTWSRSQLDNIKIEKTNFNLNEAIIEEIENLNSQALTKNIIIEFSPSSENIVFADMNSISLVIRNLISNAIKYSYANGEIIISVEKVDQFIECSIKDNGVGIESAKLENLFNFEDVVSTNGTNNETGTGLGLMLCNEFILKNNGNISVDSEPLKGSIFKFTLPKQNLHDK